MAGLLLVGCGKEQPAEPSPEALREEIKRELKAELREELKSELKAEMMTARPARRGPPPVDPRQPVRREEPAEPAPVRAARAVEPADEPAPIPVYRPDPDPVVHEDPLDEPAEEPLQGPADPAPASPLELQKLVIAQAVQDRNPVGEGVNFDASEVPKLYAWVEVKNPGDDSQVTIEWLYLGDIQSRMDLKVGHSTRGWRTWSSARITPKQVGNWTVRVLDPAGAVLGNAAFAVR